MTSEFLNPTADPGEERALVGEAEAVVGFLAHPYT
jgi:hypothetical protein